MSIDAAAVTQFRDGLRGELLQANDEGYDSARKVWNEMVDRRPLMIARCTGAADVISAVNFARAHDLLVSVRGGGHNVAGNAVCDQGLMIDLAPMKSVRVDPAARTVRADPGVTWAEVNHETQAFGLATTGGVVSHTGVAGLTLGGGVGWLMSRYGFTCDNLLSADVVTADGSLLHASSEENDDLFWAIRGGGGNFGIATSFEYRLHPVERTVFGGMVLWPFDKAGEVLRLYREICRDCPDDLVANAALICTPEGDPVVAIVAAWLGDIDEGEMRLASVRNFGTPAADMLGPIPYTQLNMLFDDGVPFGVHRYWKSGYFAELGDDLLDRIIEHAAERTSPMAAVLLFHVHGEATRRDPADTAFSLREPLWDFDIVAQWTDPSEAENHIGWTRRFWSAVESFSKGVYVNHLDADDATTRVQAAYGGNYARLTELKAKYDPTNFFRMNNNIPPR